jgi:hypothetical protein
MGNNKKSFKISELKMFLEEYHLNPLIFTQWVLYNRKRYVRKFFCKDFQELELESAVRQEPTPIKTGS